MSITIDLPTNADPLIDGGAAAAASTLRLSVQAVQTVTASGDFTTATLNVELPNGTFTTVDADAAKLLEFSAPGAHNITLAPGVRFKFVLAGGTNSDVVLYTGRVESSP